MSEHPNLLLGLGVGLLLLGAAPLLAGMAGVVGMVFRDEGPIWKILIIVAFLLFGAAFLVKEGPDGLMLGGAAMLMPLIVGLVFSTRVWKWANRPMALWLGGAFFYFSGLGILYLRQTLIAAS